MKGKQARFKNGLCHRDGAFYLKNSYQERGKRFDAGGIMKKRIGGNPRRERKKGMRKVETVETCIMQKASSRKNKL